MEPASSVHVLLCCLLVCVRSCVRSCVHSRASGDRDSAAGYNCNVPFNADGNDDQPDDQRIGDPEYSYAWSNLLMPLARAFKPDSVSYTHLTLPTIYSV